MPVGCPNIAQQLAHTMDEIQDRDIAANDTT
jgi:hypothetical protein